MTIAGYRSCLVSRMTLPSTRRSQCSLGATQRSNRAVQQQALRMRVCSKDCWNMKYREVSLPKHPYLGTQLPFSWWPCGPGVFIIYEIYSQFLLLSQPAACALTQEVHLQSVSAWRPKPSECMLVAVKGAVLITVSPSWAIPAFGLPADDVVWSFAIAERVT